jgi:hypothetical protein
MFNHSVTIVNQDLMAACSPAIPDAWSMYELAIYNLGGHMLVEMVRDPTYNIASAVWLNGLVTLVTTADNGLSVGEEIVIRGISPNAYNTAARRPGTAGLVINAKINPTTLNYALAPNPGVASSVDGATISGTFFLNARRGFRMGQFFPGVVTSASDQGTSAGIDNPDFMKGLTLENLQLLKTPYGLAYLSIAQKYGPTVWGLT